MLPILNKSFRIIKQKTSQQEVARFCERERIRTFDRLLRRQMLYPAELRTLKSC